MTKKKNNGSWVLKLLGLLFILYLSLSVAIHSGYYEAKLSEKTTITKEAMEQFEEDIKNGKDVDIREYLTDKNQDYSNQTTRLGLLFSESVESFMTKGIDGMIEIVKTLFT